MADNPIALKPVYPRYPAVNFLRRHGQILAFAVGLLPAASGAAMTLSGWSWLYGVAGLALGGFVYLLMRSYVELVAIIGDMLLPR